MKDVYEFYLKEIDKELLESLGFVFRTGTIELWANNFSVSINRKTKRMKIFHTNTKVLKILFELSSKGMILTKEKERDKIYELKLTKEEYAVVIEMRINKNDK